MRALHLFLWAGFLLACGSAVRARSAPPQPSVDRGIELYRNREFAQAAAVLEDATAASPRDARALVYLGLSRIELGQYGAAETSFRKALEVGGEAALAHYGLGLALGYQGQLEPAIAELQKAVDLDPENAYAHYHLGLGLHRKGVKDRALLHFHRFLELAPEAPEAPQVRALLSQIE
jgi:tetratricopeptide (TPR) repeat protein